MSDSARLAGLRILLLEDELFIATALRDLLLMAGADSVEISASVANATTIVQETVFDAAILDVALQDGQTFDLARKLSEDGVRIVFHTGLLESDEMNSAAPNATFLQKPSEPDALIAALAGDKRRS